VQALIQALESEVVVPEEDARQFYALTWEMLDEVQRAGMSIGSHTKTHILMTNESQQRLRDEVTGSRKEIETRLGIRVRHFAYHGGLFDAAAVEAVADAGYSFGYTICAHRDSRHPLLTVPRIGLWENACRDWRGAFSDAILDCQTNRVFELVGRCRHQHGTSQRRTVDVRL
jgi:peptidoglycan/xylan/chitin deacetylase (PgdA/CDA1 family)